MDNYSFNLLNHQGNLFQLAQSQRNESQFGFKRAFGEYFINDQKLPGLYGFDPQRNLQWLLSSATTAGASGGGGGAIYPTTKKQKIEEWINLLNGITEDFCKRIEKFEKVTIKI